MKNKGFLSRELIVLALGLVLSVVVVGSLYRNYIWPIAEDIQIASRVDASQNPDAPMVADRSFVMILKDEEQMLCLMLMMWAMIIIVYKFFALSSESSVTSYPFLKISKGERILPEEALGHYKDLESEVARNPRLQGKIFTDVVLASLHRFDATRSIQDATQSAQQRTETAFDQLESDLSLLRYIAWAIPSVGFIGTVRGIGGALALADEAIRGDISGVTSQLGLAFNSTLVALLLSIVLMFFVHLLQSKQEQLLIDLGDMANKKVIGLMKTPISDSTPVSYS